MANLKENFERIKNVSESLGWEVLRYKHEPRRAYFIRKEKNSGLPFCVLIEEDVAESLMDSFKTFTSERYAELYGSWSEAIIENSYKLCKALENI